MLPGQTGLQVGDVLAGKYRVERVLGMGGMGVVLAATHLHLYQAVAIKLMLPEALQNREMTQRFLQEARAAVRLRSEHVARVVDVGTLENGLPYMVMEYLEGSDLGHVAKQFGPLLVNQAVDFILQACEAIAEAHSLGIVHRDLKPGNLFVTRQADGSPLIKVLDFGIAKAMGTDLNMTRTSTVMGSPAYMSPEQMRSARQVDARSDVWSLGIILHELVTGYTPWQAETLTELCLKITMDPLAPMPKLRQGAVPGFEAVVRRCLEKDAAERFQSVGDLAKDLARFGPPGSSARADRVARITMGEGVRAGSSTPMPGVNSMDVTVARRKSRAPAFIAGGILAGGIAAGIAIAIAGRGKPPVDQEVRVAAPPPAPVVVPAPAPPDAAVPPPPDAAVAPPPAPAVVEPPPPATVEKPGVRRPPRAPTKPKPATGHSPPERDPLESPD